ncbi:uncharacterized protein LOC126773456 isoform X2 [Nymphalis io]|uniref:uncharacterized protein LOC126773456 isoform X2 n=1 Tax=Inachis io TaxID=171585 RepID=UPI002167D9B6|nr:uncharacterized protein LOC126773456 isoform X2 [Nymphalis io]
MKQSILFIIIKCIFLCNTISCLHQRHHEQFAKRLYQYEPRELITMFGPPSQASLPRDNIAIQPPRTLLKLSLERYNAMNDNLYSGFPRNPPDYSMNYLKNKYFNLNKAARLNELTQADNEKLRDWLSQRLNTLTAVTVPSYCPSGQPDEHGYCRDVWHLRTPPPPLIKASAKEDELKQADNENIRDWMSQYLVLRKCSSGQPDVNGNCREASESTRTPPPLINKITKENELTQADKEKIRNWITQQLNTLTVVTVPPSCPSGQPDEHGHCREVWHLRTPPPSLMESSGQFRSAETSTYIDWDNMVK